MHTRFKNIIQTAVDMYTKHSTHPAIKYEVIGIFSDALEKMDAEEILAFDKWFFSKSMRKDLKENEHEVIKILETMLQ